MAFTPTDKTDLTDKTAGHVSVNHGAGRGKKERRPAFFSAAASKAASTAWQSRVSREVRAEASAAGRPDREALI
jgi:hypothetical protein